MNTPEIQTSEVSPLDKQGYWLTWKHFRKSNSSSARIFDYLEKERRYSWPNTGYKSHLWIMNTAKSQTSEALPLNKQWYLLAWKTFRKNDLQIARRFKQSEKRRRCSWFQYSCHLHLWIKCESQNTPKIQTSKGSPSYKQRYLPIWLMSAKTLPVKGVLLIQYSFPWRGYSWSFYCDSHLWIICESVWNHKTHQKAW